MFHDEVPAISTPCNTNRLNISEVGSLVAFPRIIILEYIEYGIDFLVFSYF